MKVLLVDDEVEFVRTLAERLSFRGIEAEWVSEPETAVAKVEGGGYDLAVLDIKMPRIDGLELERRLQRTCPGMNFIFLTGHGSPDDYAAGSAEAGSDYYLLKPLRLEDLVAKINLIRTGVRERSRDD